MLYQINLPVLLGTGIDIYIYIPGEKCTEAVPPATRRLRDRNEPKRN